MAKLEHEVGVSKPVKVAEEEKKKVDTEVVKKDSNTEIIRPKKGK